MKNSLPRAAGSDSHFLFEFGSTYTELPDLDLDNPHTLLKSLPQASLVTKRAPIYARGTTSIIFRLKSLLR